MLAGVSVSWYTWLEQGRDIRVSTATLERLGQALRLDRAELAHLFALSLRHAPYFETNDQPTDGLVELVQAINPVPAYVRNGRLDVLAWNPAVADLFVDFAQLKPDQRNTLRLTFLYKPYRGLLRDWEQFARGMLRVFIAARARAWDKAPYDQLVDEISARSKEFRAWWLEGDVQGFDEGIKRLRHPTRGLLDLTYVALAPLGQPDLSLVTYASRPGSGD